ncbi:hypothetical protein FSPOR_10589 [Fusarium sporotrichioides]|uniref:Uncharacterized protein n=1 Tax=Fusarium sporotrichioides TaxID=5514 RepID=A0A395RL84_FUSSP|nr:hypothetical protein FSPOR_10589 [Fusarium sporotrichioides]
MVAGIRGWGHRYIDDKSLEEFLSRAGQFDARTSWWKKLRKGYETQLNINDSPENKELVREYVRSLSLDDRRHWSNPTEAEINDLWWQMFSPMARGDTPSARGLLSLLLLVCDGLDDWVHTGFAPIEINQLELVETCDLSYDEVQGLSAWVELNEFTVRVNVRMGFPTPHDLFTHLRRKRLLVNIVEAKEKGGEVYYPTFLLDTNSWSLYIYLAQMLTWAGVTTRLRYYAPPITPVQDKDVFGHAMVDVFMIFLTLRGWVGLDFKSVIWGRHFNGAGIEEDLDKYFIIPQRDWALGESWKKKRADRRGPYRGTTQGVSNVIAFLGTVICDHMGLNRREYKDSMGLCCIDDWTYPKTVYNLTKADSLKRGRFWMDGFYDRTNLGSVQILTWDDVKVISLERGGHGLFEHDSSSSESWDEETSDSEDEKMGDSSDEGTGNMEEDT